jgi:lysophospholipase L1-like esterase
MDHLPKDDARVKTLPAPAALLLVLLAGCGLAPASPTPAPTATSTVTPRPPPTPTASPSPSPTEPAPLTLVFYGDSLLKVGEVGRQGESGFSFVDELPSQLLPDDVLIVANYGGRKARWASENLEAAVLAYEPDVVTLWWSMNDLGGCPGIFDRDTNALIEARLTALVEDYAYYLALQIDGLLERGIPVFVLTAMPVLGGDLPWSHFDENNQLVWEENHWCRYNLGLERLAQAQRDLAAGYAAGGRPVFLVDVWQIYLDHPEAGKMYMDSVHPGSHGAALIAEGWLNAFRESGIR